MDWSVLKVSLFSWVETWWEFVTLSDMLSWFLVANPVESAVHRFLWEAVRCEVHVRVDGHEAWGRGHRQSQEAPLNSYGRRSHSWAGTIVDTITRSVWEAFIQNAELNERWWSTMIIYTTTLHWHGMDRYLNILNAVITGPTGLSLKARKAWQSDPANWMVPDRTFRNRVTIGSSFKSSFSRAATSMEYTRKTPLTSAVCTEIYWKKKKRKRPTTSIQCGSLWEPHNDQAEIMYLLQDLFTLALLMTLQFGPIQTCKLEYKTNLLSLRIMKQKKKREWRTTRINFWRVDSLSLAYVIRT